MEKNMKTLTIAKDGVEGYFYDEGVTSNKCIILLLVFKGNGYIVKHVAKWLNRNNIAALGISTYSTKQIPKAQYLMPLEWVEHAVLWLKQKQMDKIGVMGISMGALMALSAAARIPEISLCISCSGYDIVFEGTDGSKFAEWPSGKSAFTWRGTELPYQPYYLGQKEFMQLYKEQSKVHGEAYGKAIFDHSLSCGVPPEESYIPVEYIKGSLLIFADIPDTEWDTVGAARRIRKRLQEKGFSYPLIIKEYQYGSHALFPECIPGLTIMARSHKYERKFKKQCLETRIDIRKTIEETNRKW